ncbi:MAG: PEP-CTERM sorting domain-containing protein [Thermodesulfobacteriota bacterium]
MKQLWEKKVTNRSLESIVIFLRVAVKRSFHSLALSKGIVGCLCIVILAIANVGSAAQIQADFSFQSNNNSIWGSQFNSTVGNWRQDMPLFQWNETAVLPPFPWDTSLTAGVQMSSLAHTDGSVGLSPWLSFDTGTANLGYNAQGITIEYPDANSVSPGELFTIQTSAPAKATKSLNTTPIRVDAGVDIIFDTNNSLTTNIHNVPCLFCAPYDVTAESSFSINPASGVTTNVLGIETNIAADAIYQGNYIPGLRYENNSVTLLNEAVTDSVNLAEGVDVIGYGTVALNQPDTSISTANQTPNRTGTAVSDDLLRLTLDIDEMVVGALPNIIEAATGEAINIPGLSGNIGPSLVSGWLAFLDPLMPVLASYDLFAVDTYLDLDLRQKFEFTPNDLMVSFDMGNGTTFDTIKVGQSLELVMPDSAVEITPIFSLPDSTFSNLTEVVFDAGIDAQVAEFGVKFQNFLNWIPDVSIGPLEQFSFNIDTAVKAINDAYYDCPFADLACGLLDASYFGVNEFLEPLLGIDIVSLPISTYDVDTWLSPDIFDQTFSVDMQEFAASAFTVTPLSDYNGGSGGGTSSVPEPSTLLLLGSGLAGLGLVRRGQRG